MGERVAEMAPTIRALAFPLLHDAGNVMPVSSFSRLVGAPSTSRRAREPS